MQYHVLVRRHVLFRCVSHSQNRVLDLTQPHSKCWLSRGNWEVTLHLGSCYTSPTNMDINMEEPGWELICLGPNSAQSQHLSAAVVMEQMALNCFWPMLPFLPFWWLVKCENPHAIVTLSIFQVFPMQNHVILVSSQLMDWLCLSLSLSIHESQVAVREEKIWEQVALQRRWLLHDASLLDYTPEIENLDPPKASIFERQPQTSIKA